MVDLFTWRLISFLVVVGWFLLLFLLARRLRLRHPGTADYLDMSFLSGSSMRGTWRLLVFLLTGRYLRLHDPVLNVVCTVMALWFPAGVVWIFGPSFRVFELS